MAEPARADGYRIGTAEERDCHYYVSRAAYLTKENVRACAAARCYQCGPLMHDEKKQQVSQHTEKIEHPKIKRIGLIPINKLCDTLFTNIVNYQG